MNLFLLIVSDSTTINWSFNWSTTGNPHEFPINGTTFILPIFLPSLTANKWLIGTTSLHPHFDFLISSHCIQFYLLLLLLFFPTHLHFWNWTISVLIYYKRILGHFFYLPKKSIFWFFELEIWIFNVEIWVFKVNICQSLSKF